MKIAALVLAAGLSQRYGASNKLLALVDEEPMVLRVVRAVSQANINSVVVVTGHEADLVEKALGEIPNVNFVKNTQYQLGMSSSIVAGAHFLEGMDGCLICLADLPWLTTADYNYFVAKFRVENNLNQILVPTHAGKNGHPVIFGGHFFTALKELSISDQGAREIIENNLAKVKNIEVEHRRILQDIDTPGSLEK
jgi:molybdenum cofactor cytidylyltransferase